MTDFGPYGSIFFLRVGSPTIPSPKHRSRWDHVVYPPRSMPGTWNFWATYAEKKNRAAGAKICRWPYLTRALK